MSRQSLFPELEPVRTGMLPLDGRHRMYWEECGNAEGVPVIYLHGGPGAGCWPVHRRFFDPSHYRIVLFDQRGAGRSVRPGDLTDNTTQHLVADIERLRRHLGVERWMVFGGSWGATLALAYAETHPERCTALVLRGIFLGRRHEIDWFINGVRLIFPESWRAFAAAVPEAERDRLLQAYYRRLTDPDPAVHLPVARAWSAYEGSCSTLLPDTQNHNPRNLDDDRAALGLARIEAHYFVNGCFLGPDELLAGLGRIRHLPAVIIHGRYDMICPIASADELARAWPEAHYVVVPDAGHAAGEPGIRAALLAATERLKQAR